MKLRVKEVCKEKGMQMQELADKLGINRISLTSSINGNPTISTLEKIADALGVEVTELFQPTNGDFTALIKDGDIFHHFDSFKALKAYVSNRALFE